MICPRKCPEITHRTLWFADFFSSSGRQLMADESSLPAGTSAKGTPPDAERIKAAFAALVEVVARLRAPDGCPWDRAQTLATIKPYTLEETFEVFEAIDAGDDPGLVEELGDLLLQVVLYAQIAADEGRF